MLGLRFTAVTEWNDAKGSVRVPFAASMVVPYCAVRVDASSVVMFRVIVSFVEDRVCDVICGASVSGVARVVKLYGPYVAEFREGSVRVML